MPTTRRARKQDVIDSLDDLKDEVMSLRRDAREEVLAAIIEWAQERQEEIDDEPDDDDGDADHPT